MNNNIFKALVSGLTLAVMICPPAWADNTCGENCTWEIVGGELKIHGTGNMYDYDYAKAPWYNQKNSITKVSIDEGITRIGSTAFYKIPATEVKLPSTLKSIGMMAFRESGLRKPLILPDGLETLAEYALLSVPGPIEIPSSVKNVGYSNGASSLIINAKENFQFRADAFTGFNNIPTSVSIQCKGDIKICENMLAKVKKFQEEKGKTFNFSSYKGLDKNGNWIEYEEDGYTVYADSSKAKLLGEYDFDGNQTGMYKYDGAGNLTAAYKNGVAIYSKTLYTPAEAAAAVKESNSNTVTITFK